MQACFGLQEVEVDSRHMEQHHGLAWPPLEGDLLNGSNPIHKVQC